MVWSCSKNHKILGEWVDNGTAMALVLEPDDITASYPKGYYLMAGDGGDGSCFRLSLDVVYSLVTLLKDIDWNSDLLKDRNGR